MTIRIHSAALTILTMLFLLAFASGVSALEKLKWGTPVKTAPQSYLPPLTADEKGFWKENGLEVEWVPFAGATPQMHAVAAGAINIGMGPSSQPMTAAARGLPVVMLAEFVPENHFFLWVRNDSPYRHIRDLKGKRIAVTGLGAPTHVFGQVIAKAQGVEKDVRFVGAGEATVMQAGLRTGAFEAMVNSFFAAAGLKVGGLIREIAWAGDYLPKPWVENVIFGRKDFTQTKPDLVRKSIRAMLQSVDYIRKNPGWAMDKMKSFQGISEEGAKLVYDKLQFTTTGRLDRKAVENVRKFHIDYGLLTEKAPAVEELFTNEYLP